MDNFIRAYDESETEWSTLAEPVTKDELIGNNKQDSHDDLHHEELQGVKRRKNKVSSPVLTIQLAVCLILLTILFLSKIFATNIYAVVKNWYDAEITATLFFSGDFSELDYSGMFSATDDEI